MPGDTARRRERRWTGSTAQKKNKIGYDSDYRVGLRSNQAPAAPGFRPRSIFNLSSPYVDLFEYQGKQYFARFGIPVSAGDVAETVDEAVAAAERAGYPVTVKAQVQVGGRGKAGGIKIANNEDEVRDARREHPRHGHQGSRRRTSSGSSTPPTSRRSTTHRSLSTVVPRSTSRWSVEKGGVEIEQVAEENPDAIIKHAHRSGRRHYRSDKRVKLVTDAGLDEAAIDGAAEILAEAVRVFCRRATRTSPRSTR